MIPTSLRIKGLYSYQKEQAIDFQQLLEGQIFGIFGTVGSGKSSILEAITFALYGETDRLNQRENRSYNMMNLKSNELVIDFIFKNHDGLEYRFNVQGRRNRKNFESVGTYKRSAYKRKNGVWEPIKDTDAASILGLSYENFKRTIIIPQGKFQEFLQLGVKDRTTMLKEIFHLDKYEFSQQTAAIDKQNSGEIQNIVGQLTGFVAVTNEAIKEKEENVNLLVNDQKEKESELFKKEQDEREQSETNRLFEELEEKITIENKLKMREKLINAEEEDLNAYEYCLATFKAKLDTMEELREQKETEELSLRKNKEEHSEITGKLDIVEKDYKKVSEEYDDLDNIKMELADYERILEILNIDDTLGKLNNDLEASTKKLDEVDTERIQWEKKIKTQKEELRKKRAALPDVSLLTELKTWYDVKMNLEKEIIDLQREIRILENQKQEIVKDVSSEIPKYILTAIDIGADLDSHILAIKKFRAQNKTEQKKLQEIINQYHVQAKLGEYVDILQDGEPCPLCGALEHPDILDVEDVSVHIRQARDKMQKHEEIENACDSTLEKLSSITIELNNLDTEIGKKQNKLEKYKQDTVEHRDGFLWEGYTPDDDALVTNQLKELKSQQNEINKLEDTLDSTEKAYESAVKKYDELKDDLTNTRTTIQSNKSVKESYLKQLVIAQYIDGKYVKTNVEKNIWHFRQKIQRIEVQYKKLTNERNYLNVENHKVADRIKYLADALESTTEKLSKLENELMGLLTESPYNTLDEIQSIIQRKPDVKAIRNEIIRFRNELYKAIKDVENLMDKTKSKKFDPEEHRKLQEEVNHLRTVVKHLQEKVGGERSELQKLKEDIKTKEKLEKQLEQLNNRAENLKLLKSLFKANGFVNYVSSVFLHNLCNAANERFNQLTRQQLRLEINEKNEFEVRDFLNDGKVRSVKTLSGGQTFQASLSLALALAESVQHQNQQNFFFLDEGFGSLDRDALQIVFDTLKSLRKENRIVGIISHVDELQQEIDMYIRVTNDLEKGSIIKESWVN